MWGKAESWDTKGTELLDLWPVPNAFYWNKDLLKNESHHCLQKNFTSTIIQEILDRFSRIVLI